MPVSLTSVEQLTKRGVDLTTKGEFSEALKIFREALRSVAMCAVTSSQEQKKLQQLIAKTVEYITAMRVEIERKKLVAAQADPVRIAELACLMTLCNMEDAHKFLAYKSAFTLLYKMGNFITAAHFARQIVALEPSGTFASKPEIVPQYKKYFQACQTKGSNAHKLSFEPNDSVTVREITSYLCCGSLAQLTDNRSVNTVKCPLDGSVYAKQAYNDTVCETCQLCKLGADAMGLNVLLEGMQA